MIQLNECMAISGVSACACGHSGGRGASDFSSG